MEPQLLLEFLLEKTKDPLLSEIETEQYKNLFQAFIEYISDPYYVQVIFNANVFYPVKFDSITDVLVDDASKSPEIYTLEDARFWFAQIERYAEDLTYGKILAEITYQLDRDVFSSKVYIDILKHFGELE